MRHTLEPNSATQLETLHIQVRHLSKLIEREPRRKLGQNVLIDAEDDARLESFEPDELFGEQAEENIVAQTQEQQQK